MIFVNLFLLNQVNVQCNLNCCAVKCQCFLLCVCFKSTDLNRLGTGTFLKVLIRHWYWIKHFWYPALGHSGTLFEWKTGLVLHGAGKCTVKQNKSVYKENGLCEALVFVGKMFLYPAGHKIQLDCAVVLWIQNVLTKLNILSTPRPGVSNLQLRSCMWLFHSTPYKTYFILLCLFFKCNSTFIDCGDCAFLVVTI